MMRSDIGIVVGSGHRLLGLDIVSRSATKTAYGPPSGPILTAAFGDVRVAVILRHGERHTLAPHDVNYRANIEALHQLGVRRCIALNTVGTIAADFIPGELAVPIQLIDYTWGRQQTFGGEQPVHVEFTDPVDTQLAALMRDCVEQSGSRCAGGVYGVTQGPRLETAAEIDRLERDGCTMVGMTAMPEAALAAERGMAYAICAVGVNHAAGRAPQGRAIHADIERHLQQGLEKAGRMLRRLIPALATQCDTDH
jgi:5'-methylthioinosine phosphorylase